jgi:hypothetical protein
LHNFRSCRSRQSWQVDRVRELVSHVPRQLAVGSNRERRRWLAALGGRGCPKILEIALVWIRDRPRVTVRRLPVISASTIRGARARMRLENELSWRQRRATACQRTGRVQTSGP